MKYLIHTLFLMTFGLILDFVWIGYLAGDFYRSKLSHILRLNSDGSINAQIFPALFVYLFFALGIQVFVDKMSQGALLGLVIYGVYDFTNVSLFQGWTWDIAAVDIGWGIFLLTCMSAFYLKVLRKK
ncbi:MAG: DUF2177 family protein [Bacteriovoracaceae bacterium]|nr:DUF2177 family protein [Bacteriovoracaceae bacterium]